MASPRAISLWPRKLTNCARAKSEFANVRAIRFETQLALFLQDGKMKFLSRIFAVLALTTAALSQADQIAPNENLVAEGIPKIPVFLSYTAQRYTNFRAAVLDSWNHTKREMLIPTRFADTSHVPTGKCTAG